MPNGGNEYQSCGTTALIIGHAPHEHRISHLAGLLLEKVHGREIDDVPFPVDVFGESPPVRDLIQAVSEIEGVPDSLVGISCLGAVSAALGAGLALRTLPEWESPPNLFLFPAIESGGGKTITSGYTHKVLRELDQGMAREWKTKELPKNEVEVILIEEEIKCIKRVIRAGVPTEEDLLRLHCLLQRRDQVKILKTNEPTILIEDVTPAELAASLYANGEVLAVVSSDGRSVVDQVRRNENFYLKAWSRDSHKESRITRHGAQLSSPCLSMLVLIQPDKFEELMAKEQLLKGGLIPRILVAQIESSERRLTGMMIPPLDAWVRSAYDGLIGALASTYLLTREPARVVECDRDALELWFAFHDLCEDMREELSADFTPLVKRWAEHATRIAINLHAARYGPLAHEHRLCKSTMAHAIDLSSWFCMQQLDVVASQFAQREQTRLERLVALLKRKPGQQETIRNLVKSHKFGKDELRQLAANNRTLLVINTVQSGLRSNGGRPSEMMQLIERWRSF